MKVPVEWINEYLADKLSARKMAEAMEKAGIEVESVQEATAIDKKIVIGSVRKLSAHPNADKLKIAQVDVGSGTLQIICGAPNIAVDQKVAVAMIGAVLPDDTKITKSKIRGEISEGMICSERELGLGDNHQGIMVIKEGKIGQSFAEIITTKATIDVKTAANRWDLTSIIGVAREVASQTHQPLKIKQLELDFGQGDRPRIAPDLPADLVSIYLLAPLKVDASLDSPQWLKDRLLSCGIRPIGAVVDVTNYILLEYGQPLHAFDAAKIKGEVSVRSAKSGETLQTLDGVKRKLNSTDAVIADSNGALALAGVMGGATSEVTSKTTQIYLEAASFNSARVRKTAMRHGLRSEASARFERGVPAYPHQAVARAIQLLIDYAAGRQEGAISVQHNLKDPSPRTKIMTVDLKRVSRLLGLQISRKEANQHLRKLEFEVDDREPGEIMTIVVPWWRADVSGEADIAEELIKLIGYEKLPATIPSWEQSVVEFDATWANLWSAKGVLRSQDLFEVTTYSLISKEQIEQLGQNPEEFYELDNPLSLEQAYLRRDILPSLLAAAVQNRKFSKRFGVFEFSKNFHKTKPGQLPDEVPSLAALVVSPDDAYMWVKSTLDRLSREMTIDYRIEPQASNDIYHPTRSGRVIVGGKAIGVIGQIHPELSRKTKISGQIGYLELDWEQWSLGVKPKLQSPISPFPAIARDITVLLDRNIYWQDVVDELKSHKVSFINDYYGKDLPEDKKTLTIRVVIERFDRTPTEKDADKVVSTVISTLNNKFKSEIR